YTLGEFALVACVVYHALNGFRIVIFDWRPQWWHRQADAAKLVLIGTVILLVPTFILMGSGAISHYQQAGLDLKLPELISPQAEFALGAVVILILGIAVSAVYSLIPGANTVKKGKPAAFDRFMWSFMRVSGLIIIPLVFGHLGMIHVIQGVF